MRRLRDSVSVVLVGVCSVLLLTSCLVSGKDKTKKYTISLPANLPIYQAGDYILMQYVDPYLVNGNRQSPNSNISMRWDLSQLTEPFTGQFRNTLRYVFQGADGSAVQYVTQDTQGSIFLHAFGGVNAQNNFWPDAEGILSNGDPAPLPMQVFWSPIHDGAAENKLNFFVMGECNTSACASLADFNITESEVASSVREVVDAPLGHFETYRIHYGGTMNARTMNSIPPHFDYRISCWTPGNVGTVSFEGDVWIYPPIGPVQIQNTCTASSNSGFVTIKYTAKITGTNLPF